LVSSVFIYDPYISSRLNNRHKTPQQAHLKPFLDNSPKMPREVRYKYHRYQDQYRLKCHYQQRNIKPSVNKGNRYSDPPEEIENMYRSVTKERRAAKRDESTKDNRCEKTTNLERNTTSSF
jgi:hypothetical protein